MNLPSSAHAVCAAFALVLFVHASSPGWAQPVPEGTIVHRDLVYVPNGHARQKLDLYLPKGDKVVPLIIHIHGGAFKMGSKEQGVPYEWLAQGYAVASINYRLSQHAKFPAQIEDCKAAVRWLRAHSSEFRLDSRRFASLGSSAGGHLAAMLGAAGEEAAFDVGSHLDQSSRVQAVVDYFGPTDFLQMDAYRLPNGMLHDPADSPESELIGGAIQGNREKTARANPITYVTPDDPPFLICHGDKDPLVPYHQSVLLEAALKQAGVAVTFYTVEGGGHGGFKDPKVTQLTREFLARHLKAEPEVANSVADLSAVPQLHETPEQRDARMQWFRDAKFGMFVHWGPCTVGDREIGWGRKANRPWDINGVQTPRTSDPDYDAYYKRFNPTNYDAKAWVRLAKEAGMRYMVLIAKHHDGFAQFDSKLSEHDIMATPHGRDIVKPFVEACRSEGMKVGLYYSTRDWFHPDYLVGDNAAYDAWYRGQVEELLSNYGKIDVMWFDHVGGQDWGKWRFDQLFSMMYRLQPDLIVNNRAARFCGPSAPGDRGPATPEIRKMTDGDFDTPEQQIGAMNLGHDWESCMILSPTPQGDGWSYRSNGKTRPLDECIRMLASTASGGGNLLLNFGPDQSGAFRPEEIAIAKGMGAWLQRYGGALYGTRGGPFTNGKWGGSTHRGSTVYLHVFDGIDETLHLAALPQKIMKARVLPGGAELSVSQTAQAIEIAVPAAQRDHPVTVIELALDQAVTQGQQVGVAGK